MKFHISYFYSPDQSTITIHMVSYALIWSIRKIMPVITKGYFSIPVLSNSKFGKNLDNICQQLFLPLDIFYFLNWVQCKLHFPSFTRTEVFIVGLKFQYSILYIRRICHVKQLDIYLKLLLIFQFLDKNVISYKELPGLLCPREIHCHYKLKTGSNIFVVVVCLLFVF